MSAPLGEGTTKLAEMLNRHRRADGVSVPWSPNPWIHSSTGAGAGRVRLAESDVIRRLEDRATEGGLLRTDVVAAASEPVDLLIASMAWGCGNRGYGAARTTRMLGTEGVDKSRRISSKRCERRAQARDLRPSSKTAAPDASTGWGSPWVPNCSTLRAVGIRWRPLIRDP